MNHDLTKEIVSHIFSGFSLLKSPDFLLPRKFSFLMDDEEKSNSVWGCQIPYLSQNVDVLLVDCENGGMEEKCLIIALKGSPVYALYFDEEASENDMIATSLDGKGWIECNHYLQGTFLAAMEQMKEMQVSAKRLENVDELFSSMLSFIEFHDGMLDEGDDHEG